MAAVEFRDNTCSPHSPNVCTDVLLHGGKLLLSQAANTFQGNIETHMYITRTELNGAITPSATIEKTCGFGTTMGSTTNPVKYDLSDFDTVPFPDCTPPNVRVCNGTGEYSLAPTVTCSICQLGKVPATNNKGPGGGATACVDNRGCPIGQYAGAGTCKNCTAGQYQPIQKAIVTSCTLCLAGRYADETGRFLETQCERCAKGRWTPSGSATRTSCSNCAAGKFSSKDGTLCVGCPKGRYTNKTGQFLEAHCTKCTPGKYQNNTGQSESSACKTCTSSTNGGVYSLSGDPLCRPCTGKKLWQNMSGQPACKTCDPGLVANEPYNNLCVCAKACLPGTFLNPGTVLCEPCPAGTALTSYGGIAVGACLNCSAGLWSDEKGLSSSCKKCPKGRSGVLTGGTVMETTCTRCKEGLQYQNVAGQTACKSSACQKGTYSIATANSDTSKEPTCTGCPTGKFNAAIGLTKEADCSECPSGRFLTTTGADSIDLCVKCPAGKVSPTIGANVSTSCVVCPVGRFQSSEGSGECQLCPAGKHGNVPGQINEAKGCTSCDAGKFNSLEGSKAEAGCTGCPRGRWGATAAASSQGMCIMCEVGRAGRNSSAKSIDTCEWCNKGDQYQDLPGQSSCKSAACPPGKWGAGTTNARCTDCPKGKYSGGVIIKESGCIPCQFGTWGDLEGISRDTDCHRCAVGKHGDTEGATRKEACTDCIAGRYYPTDGLGGNATNCFQCPAGRYGTKQGAASIDKCILCPAGAFGVDQGMAHSNCTGLCPAGTYSLNGFTKCLPCPQGRIAPSPGTGPECEKCKSNTLTTLGEGSTVCVCEKGAYMNDTGTCVSCPDDVTCDKAGSTLATVDLKAGAWRLRNTSNAIYDCPIKGTCLGGNTTDKYVHTPPCYGKLNHRHTRTNPHILPPPSTHSHTHARTSCIYTVRSQGTAGKATPECSVLSARMGGIVAVLCVCIAETTYRKTSGLPPAFPLALPLLSSV